MPRSFASDAHAVGGATLAAFSSGASVMARSALLWAALARADRVVVLDRGRVADEGTWDELSVRWSHLAG